MNGNGLLLTPDRAWASAHDAASMQMRKAGRKRWNRDDYNRAVEVQSRLLSYLPLCGDPECDAATCATTQQIVSGMNQ